MLNRDLKLMKLSIELEMASTELFALAVQISCVHYECSLVFAYQCKTIIYLQRLQSWATKNSLKIRCWITLR